MSVCVCACGVVWCKSMRCVRCVVSVCSRVSLTPTLVTLGREGLVTLVTFYVLCKQEFVQSQNYCGKIIMA